MNPSAPGWIDKLVYLLPSSKLIELDEERFYEKLRGSGFLYGSNVYPAVDLPMQVTLTENELAKVNLVLALRWTAFQSIGTIDESQSMELILSFYKNLQATGYNLLDKLFTGSKISTQLEKIIGYRVLFDKNVFTRNFSHLMTNALLMVDVLAFRSYLNGDDQPAQNARLWEQLINRIILRTLEAKEHPSEYDILLLEMIKSSLRYQEAPKGNWLPQNQENNKFHPTLLERRYLLDLACLSAWGDDTFPKKEQQPLWDVGEYLGLSAALIEDSISFAQFFRAQYNDQIPLLRHSHPVKHFYDQTTRTVSTLILRNKKRLVQELAESGELMLLLGKSTVKGLSAAERVKVKRQLMNIFKSIPSLAIFALPGGAFLLPLFIKLIPKLLPSAFDDNRIE